ncbi:MAG TPA: hypothetical protein VKB52_01955 [Rhodanobacteraceae bacterium]|nr:hypothetical protein [Rhodanobacteraceae bacterium]
MNWDAIGALSQLVAAIGLIPSVVYLAIQVGAQNKAHHRASLDMLTTQWGDLIQTVNESEDFGRIYLDGLESFIAMEPVRKIRFGAYLLRVFRYWEAMSFHFEDGTLHRSSWKALQAQMADIISYAGVQEWWRTRQHWYTDEFRGVVDAMIASGIGKDSYRHYGVQSKPGEASDATPS